MSEKILRIEEFSEGGMDGYKVVTDVQTITLGISNGQYCCEQWGYLWSNDDLTEFTDAEVSGVSITDTSLNPAKYNREGEYYEGSCMFVNIETSKGTLQFVAYNEHNGYYGHEAVVVSHQLTHSEYL